MSDQDRIMSALDKIDAAQRDFVKSHASELMVAKEGLATVQGHVAEMQKQLQDIAALAAKGRTSSTNTVHRALGECIKKAASGTTDAAGGYLINDDLRTELLSVQNIYGTVRQLCNVMPMASDVVKIAVDTFDVPGVSGVGNVPTPVAYNENSAITESADAALSQVTLTAQKYATLNYVPNELLQDAFLDYVGAYLLPKIARQMARIEDGVVFTAATTGLLNTSNVQVVNMESGDTGFGNLFTLANAVAYLSAMQDAVVNDVDGRYIMHRSIVNGLRGVKGSDSYVWAPMSAGEPAQILGYGYAKSEVFPARAASAGATGFVLFGDLNLGCVVGERGQRSIVASEHFRFNYDQVAVRMTERFAFATNANIGRALSVLKTAAA